MLSRCSSHGFWSAANSLLPASRRSRNSATATTCQRSEETSPVPHARGTHHDPSTRHRLRSRCPTRARNSPLGNLDRAGVALATVPGESSVRGSDRCAYRPCTRGLQRSSRALGLENECELIPIIGRNDVRGVTAVRPPVPGVASDPPLIQLIRERRDRRERRGDEPSELTLVRLTARGAEAVPECRGEGRLPNSLGDRSGSGHPSVRQVDSRGTLRGGGRECSRLS